MQIKCTENSYLGGRIFSAGSYYEEEEIPYVHRKEKCIGFEWIDEPKKKAGRPPKEPKDEPKKKAGRPPKDEPKEPEPKEPEAKEDNV